MTEDDDLLSRLGALARAQEREIEEELSAPSMKLEAPAALRAKIVAQALEANPRRPAQAARLSRRALLLPVAAAAALLIFLGTRSDENLPAYVLSHQGGLEATRGEDASGIVTLRRSSQLELTLRPRIDVDGPVTLRLLLSRNGKITPLRAPVEPAPSGAFRTRIDAGAALEDVPGPATIIAIVCRPDACEQAQAELAERHDAGASQWQILSLSIGYVP